MTRIEVITSVERRRRWSRAEKERWVAALEAPGAVAVEVARRAGVDPSLLYRWRRQAMASREVVSFVPVAIAADAAEHAAEPAEPPPAAMTIEFSGGARLKVEGAPDAGTLTRVIGALSRAERRR
ncbi:IS66-like element accessory protein TnpA [Rhodoblastus sp.]|jgi:transposase|uniref:IS66-like element accessory protein TnpA n=1 Tax=Rhodoblastus sp. TaxID=1962975 RepID=UPI003F9D24C8